jgi:hypothetical protein
MTRVGLKVSLLHLKTQTKTQKLLKLNSLIINVIPPKTKKVRVGNERNLLHHKEEDPLVNSKVHQTILKSTLLPNQVVLLC